MYNKINNFYKMGEYEQCVFPLSAAQRGMWFAQEINPDAHGKVFKATEYLEIFGFIDADIFEIAVRQTIKETDALQLIFQYSAQGPQQRFGLSPDWTFPILDFREEADPSAAAEQWMRADMAQPFDLQQGPLFSFALIQLAAEHFIYYASGHHLVIDGFGASIFSRRIADIYSALVTGSEPLASPFVGLSNILELERVYEGSAHCQRDRQYWIDLLENCPIPESLAEQQAAACSDILRQQMYLPAQTSDRLRHLANQCQSTLPQLLITLIAIYLHRMTGQQDLLVGLPMTARTNRTLRAFPGMTANVLPLRLNIEGTASLADCLQQVKRRVMGAVRHQGYRGENLSADLGLVAEGSSLYATSINILPFQYDMKFGDCSVAAHSLSSGPVNDLSINLCDRGSESGLELCLDANAALYSEDVVGCHFQRLVHFLNQAASADPEMLVGKYEVLMPEERTLILETWNQTQLVSPTERCAHDLFEQQVEQYPDAIAVVCAGQQLSYRQLNEQANRLAHYLLALGIGPEKRVGLCFDRGADLIVAMLATLKAGGGYIPMDPAYPSERLQYMLSDSRPEVLLSDGIVAMCDLFSEGIPTSLRVVNLNTDRHLWAKMPPTNPIWGALTPDLLAYIIYTSGSTGKPKGVMVEHRNLVNLVHWHNQTFDVKVGTCASSVAGLGFDAAVWEIWPPLCAGACLHLPTLEISRDPEQLLDWWASQPIEVGFLSTPIAELAFARHLNPPTLRHLLVGGDRLNRHPHPDAHFTLVNNYGPTETTVVATSGNILSTDHVLHIGRPVANTQIYILDAQCQLVPAGVTGEIYIGGAGVARGYINLAEQTAERFLDDPFSDQPNARMYRSGDLARWLTDGTIEYQGRNDNQVKIRGFRIELGEIALALQAIDGVQNAVVVALGSAAQEKRLVAYYTTSQCEDSQPEYAISAEMLKVQLSGRLPDYMVPAAYVVLASIPLTPNGKVDHRSLPEPDETAFVRRGYEAPVGELEQRLASMWQSLLGVEKVGRHDNFFELGGHSLLAVQLIEQLRHAGYHLAVKSLFTYPTLAALVETLSDNSADALFDVPPNLIPASCTEITPDMLSLVDLTRPEIGVITAGIPGGAANVQDIYPLAPLQEGILFHHRLNDAGDPYVTRLIQAFTDETQLNAFMNALQAVVKRHDILRTSLVWEGLEEPLQVVWRDAQLNVETLVIEADDVAIALQQRFDPNVTQLNVHRAPMIEAYRVADPAQNRWLLCMLMHHLCMDHTTLELMVEEVQAHLLHQEDKLPTPLPFRNFVVQSRLENDPEKQTAYFRERLGDLDEPSLPFGLLDIQGDGQHLQESHLPIEDSLTQRLRDQARLQGVSAASLFHLAWGLVVRATTGHDDVVFGTVLFGRMAAGDGADRVLGMFLNTLPLRLSLGEESVTAVVKHTHRCLAELLEYEHASLSLAQQCSGVAPQMPLFSSLINYRYNGGSEQLSMDAIQLDIVFSEERTNYPIGVSVNDNPQQGFSLDIQVDAGVGSERVGAMMLKALTQLVSALEADPTCPVCTLNVLPEAEQHQVLHHFNSNSTHHSIINSVITHSSITNGAITNSAITTSRRTNRLITNDLTTNCIHELFESQVKACPEAIAIASDNQQLNYRALNIKANQLAHYLRGLGIGPDKKVGLCFDRGPNLIIAMLAVFKAGGAYIPMDPAYPAERLQYMLSDSAPELLLTDGCVALNLILGDDEGATTPLFVDPSCTAPCLTDAFVTNHRAVLNLKTDAHLWAEQPLTNLDRGALTPNHLAYIIYTSGSTGQPKGVMVEHANLANLVHWHNQTFEIKAGTCVSSVAGVGFDAAVWEIWPPLCVGAHLVLPSLAVSRNPEQLLEWWAAHPIEVGFLSTPIAELIFARKLNHPTLRTLLVGGDKLNRYPDPEANFTLVNNYGPTECTVVATSGRIESTDKILHIGGPIANTSLYILDAHRQLAPRGVTGELYIGGKGVARGYLNRPELTAERFLDDPFSDEMGARMYRTGDLGRWLDNGTIEYLGRNDSQVKIRGFRIELGEIEASICQYSGIEEAVVVVKEGRGGDQRLIAYYVIKNHAANCYAGQTIEAEALRDYLSAHLPEYMVPVAYVLMEEIPLTPNGKVDRKMLPEPMGSDYMMQAYEAPEGPIEVRLAAIWQTLLGVEKVGRHDSFFELGGHSLMAVQFVNEAQKAGYEVSLSTLFSVPRLQELALHIAAESVHQSQTIAFRAASGSQRPLFIVPEASGEMLYGTLLTSYIDADIPVYGLVSPDRNLPPFQTIQGAAARYARIIRETQPQGPYRILGWSFGGTLAYEVAAQLLGQDQEIEFLGLLDTMAVQPQINRIVADRQQERTEEEQLFLMSKEVFDGLAFDIHGIAETENEWEGAQSWQDYYQRAQEMEILPTGWSDTYYRNWLYHREGLLRADYKVKPMPIQVDVFVAEERPIGENLADDPYLGWDRVLPRDDVRMIPVPGNHYRLVKEPAVEHVGRAISDAIHSRTQMLSFRSAITPANNGPVVRQGDDITVYS